MVVVEIGGSSSLRFEDNFAVAIPVEGGALYIVETYPSRESLMRGYRIMYNSAVERGVPKPVPVEKVDEHWKCKVLDDIVSD